MSSSRQGWWEPSSESILRLVERADGLDDPQMQRLAKAAFVTENTSLTRQIEHALALKAIQQQIQPFNKISPSATVSPPNALIDG